MSYTHNSTCKWLVIVMIFFVSTFLSEQIISKGKTKKVTGTFSEYIEVYYSDPPCDCLVGDDFVVVENGSKKNISFYDPDISYMNKYYFVESDHNEEERPGYGGATYKLREEFVNQEFTITYKSELCPGYKTCSSGKILKNIIISIE